MKIQQVLLKNLSIDLGELQAGILVRQGTVKIVGCRILASNESVVKLGIIVLPGTKLIVENTVFVGLGTAIVVHLRGECNLKKCRFENCIDGIQVKHLFNNNQQQILYLYINFFLLFQLQDESRCGATDCIFSDIKEYGIRLDLNKNLPSVEYKTGGCEILKNLENISFENCKFENSGKGDATVRLKQSVPMTPKENNRMDMNS